LARRFQEKTSSFDDLFVSYRKKVSDKARMYLCGLVRDDIRKNMYQMTQRIVDADHDSLQNFITDSKWSAQAVIDRVAQQVDGRIGDPDDAAFIIDESGNRSQPFG
jgi:SRSO17 transposase